MDIPPAEIVLTKSERVYRYFLFCFFLMCHLIGSIYIVASCSKALFLGGDLEVMVLGVFFSVCVALPWVWAREYLYEFGWVVQSRLAVHYCLFSFHVVLAVMALDKNNHFVDTYSAMLVVVLITVCFFGSRVLVERVGSYSSLWIGITGGIIAFANKKRAEGAMTLIPYGIAWMMMMDRGLSSLCRYFPLIVRDLCQTIRPASPPRSPPDLSSLEAGFGSSSSLTLGSRRSSALTLRTSSARSSSVRSRSSDDLT